METRMAWGKACDAIATLRRSLIGARDEGATISTVQESSAHYDATEVARRLSTAVTMAVALFVAKLLN